MVKRSGNGDLGGLWLERRGLTEGSEVLGLFSRVRRAAPSLQIQSVEPVEASYVLAKTATLTMLMVLPLALLRRLLAHAAAAALPDERGAVTASRERARVGVWEGGGYEHPGQSKRGAGMCVWEEGGISTLALSAASRECCRSKRLATVLSDAVDASVASLSSSLAPRSLPCQCAIVLSCARSTRRTRSLSSSAPCATQAREGYKHPERRAARRAGGERGWEVRGAAGGV